MATVFVGEYENVPRDDHGNVVPILGEHLATQTITSSGTTARTASAFNGQTQYITIRADGPVHYNLGNDSVEAAATDEYLPADERIELMVGGNTHIAVIDKA